MKCNKCKKHEAVIHMENTGGICLECHKVMGDLLGVDLMNDFSNKIAVLDVEDVLHQFEISNMLLPGFSIWRAVEVEGEYQFEVLTNPHDNQMEAIEQLHHKILKGLSHKSLKRLSNTNYYSNAINISNEQYSLNSVGTCRIEYSEDEPISLIIDGKQISYSDFGNALTSFEGFTMDFQIRNSTDDVLGRDVLLKPIRINAEDLYGRFERTLGWFLENEFLSYKRESACIEAVIEKITDLELYYNSGYRDESIEVGIKMKNRLMSLDHESDRFPDDLLNSIDQAIGITGEN